MSISEDDLAAALTAYWMDCAVEYGNQGRRFKDVPSDRLKAVWLKIITASVEGEDREFSIVKAAIPLQNELLLRGDTVPDMPCDVAFKLTDMVVRGMQESAKDPRLHGHLDSKVDELLAKTKGPSRN